MVSIPSGAEPVYFDQHMTSAWRERTSADKPELTKNVVPDCSLMITEPSMHRGLIGTARL